MLLDVLEVLLYIAFILSSLLLIVVILLQEGKGGGLAGAFGGMGGETFGVGSGGINKFTAVLAAVFIGTAIVLGATAGTSVAPQSDKPPENETAGENPGGNAPENTPATGT
jgi:preprotein translocase subunit SecG